MDLLKQSVANSVLDFYSKFELDMFKARDRIRALEANKGNNQNQPTPSESEMYKLLIKEGLKPN